MGGEQFAQPLQALEPFGLSLSAVMSTGCLRKLEPMIAAHPGGWRDGMRDLVRCEVCAAYMTCFSGVTVVQMFISEVKSLQTLPHEAPRCNFLQWPGQMNSVSP